MSAGTFTTVFGPVSSRRFGRSLGVDVIPRKVCTLDCIYCEVGRTDKRGFVRKEYLPVGRVLTELSHALPLHDSLDCITFSGSGEPTLHARLGEMLRQAHGLSGLPITVLTNGTLLWRQDVRMDLLAADIVCPSFNAVSEDIFRRINRPHPRLSAALVFDGLVAFREVYRGKFFLEILIVRGLNDTDDEIEKLKRACDRISPDRIHLNTVVRPPAEPWAQPVPFDRMEEIRAALGPRAEVLVPRHMTAETADRLADEEDITSLVSRRAMSIRELAASLSADEETVKRSVAQLVRKGTIHPVLYHGEAYYAPANLMRVS